jgi:hypothetical protein
MTARQRTTAAVEEQRGSAELRAEQADFACQRDAQRERASLCAMRGNWPGHADAKAQADDLDSRVKALEAVITEAEHAEARALAGDHHAAIQHAMRHHYPAEFGKLDDLVAAVKASPTSARLEAFVSQVRIVSSLHSGIWEATGDGAFHPSRCPTIYSLLDETTLAAYRRYRGNPLSGTPITVDLSRFGLPSGD